MNKHIVPFGSIYDQFKGIEVNLFSCMNGDLFDSDFRIEAMKVGKGENFTCRQSIGHKGPIIKESDAPCPIHSVTKVSIGSYLIYGMDLDSWNFHLYAENSKVEDCVAVTFNRAP